jgi:lantibiotic modifying enzyme
MHSRRAFLSRATVGLAALPWLTHSDWRMIARSARPYREAALAAVRWLASTARRLNDGVMFWPAAPIEHPNAEPAWDFYNGMPGTVFGLLELHRHAPSAESHALLDGGLRAMTRALENGAVTGYGLYEGHAGVAYVFAEAARVLNEPQWRAAAWRATDIVLRAAQPTHDDGVRWSTSNDIISGVAGIALTLDRLGPMLGRPEPHAMLRRAAAELLRVGESQSVGMRWRMDDSFPRVMPNFSHGTAGAAYALARAGRTLRDPQLGDAARQGGAHLQALNTQPSDGLAISHHTPGGEQLFYQSWCHGPAGTARLFDLLAQGGVRDARPFAGARAATSIERSGAPRTPSAGYWNNISQCCGHAGIGEFALGWHHRTGDSRAIALASLCADEILSRAVTANGARHWPQAENRGDPAGIQSQTGFMQGAAGVMTFLLRLDARLAGGPPPLDLPDSHWYAT